MTRPLRVLVVDDEPLARERLADLLAEAPDVVVCGTCGDGASALDAVGREQPDLVLLDVAMPGLDGLSVARALGDEAPVVFTTAHERFAVEAFDVRALDYLLKPFDASRLARALERAREERRRSAPAAGDAAQAPPRLVGRRGERTRLFTPADVERVQAAGNYVRLVADGETWLRRGTLEETARELAAWGFVRVHRSHLVNAAAIRELVAGAAGRLRLRLRSGGVLPVGRAYRRAARRLAR